MTRWWPTLANVNQVYFRSSWYQYLGHTVLAVLARLQVEDSHKLS